MRSVHVRRDSRRSIRVAATVLGMGLVAVIAGCGDGAAREPTNEHTTDKDTAETAPAETPDATAVEPDQKEPTATARLPEAEPPTDSYERELYDATVEFYSAVVEAYRTLDLVGAEKHVTADSRALSGYSNYIESVNTQGHTFDRLPEFVVTDFRRTQRATDATEEVRFRLYASGLREVDADGEEVTTIDESWSDVKIVFVRQEERWLVAIQDIE